MISTSKACIPCGSWRSTSRSGPTPGLSLGAAQGWRRDVGVAGESPGVGRLGASVPSEVLLRECAITVDNHRARTWALLAR